MVSFASLTTKCLLLIDHSCPSSPLSPVINVLSRVGHAKVEPLGVSVRVHVRSQVQFIVSRGDLHSLGQIAGLESRLKDQVLDFRLIRVTGEQVLGTTHTGPTELGEIGLVVVRIEQFRGNDFVCGT